MPKYLEPESIIPIMVTNLKSFIDLEDKEVSKYMCKLFNGILNQSTVRNHLDHTTKQTYGLGTCPKCGKNKLKSLARHLSRSHGLNKYKSKPIIEAIKQLRNGNK